MYKRQFRNKELFRKLWPVDLVDESQDQVRGWFYTLMLCGYSTFGERPYGTVCLNGWTLDEKGEKMSKSLGNVILAKEAYSELGADLLRLYYCSDVAPWDTQKFSLRSANDLRRVLNVLWNTYAFIQTYSDSRLIGKKPDHPRTEDRWIQSRINSLISEVTDNLEEFNFHLAGRSLIDFILNDLSRWYVKTIRNRVSPWYTGKDKAPAQCTLYYVLERLVKLLAPVTPFIAEKIYHETFKGESVHLCEWLKPDKNAIDKDLEDSMKIVRSLTVSYTHLTLPTKA